VVIFLWVLTTCCCNAPESKHALPSEEFLSRFFYIALYMKLYGMLIFASWWGCDRGTVRYESNFRYCISPDICRTVSITFQHIKVDDLRELLGDLEDHELQHWISSNSWTLKENDLVFVTNQEEIVKTRNIVDKVNFESEHCHL